MFIPVYMTFGSLWGHGDISPIFDHFLKVMEVGIEEEGGIRWHQSQDTFTFSLEQYGAFLCLNQIKFQYIFICPKPVYFSFGNSLTQQTQAHYCLSGITGFTVFCGLGLDSHNIIAPF